ncbi:MAG: hypothetical protein GY803_30605 [Chloroflexi bacterium]|nr:hypothetical protein [Chloroflexota bacterium]
MFGFIAMWALFAAVNASLDAIKYAEYRAKFIEIIGMTLEDIKQTINQNSDSPKPNQKDNKTQ